MGHAVVCCVALLAAALTFFSGFGLGTLLMPAFALFFPLEVAIAATAVVHLANNVFKLGLVRSDIHWRTAARFGVPAAIAAFAGAWSLDLISGASPVATYTIGSRECEVTVVKVVMATIIGGFAALELWPPFETLSFAPKLMPLGGALSGFFGGLSGHQGALRSAFLIRAGLRKEQFIATGVASAVMVDIARLVVYGATVVAEDWSAMRESGAIGLVIAASLAAFAGSVVGGRLVKKVTMKGLRLFVGVMLMSLALALAAGLV